MNKVIKFIAKPAKRKTVHAEDLPDILTAQHMAEYLTISRRRVYELLDIKPEFGGIPSFSIGTSKRARKADFLQWIEDRKNEKLSAM